MRQGFTLVELSIVLVIIGLLIGGILVAQSMVSTTKLQGVVRQLQQYDIGVANFQTRYGQLPGDSNLFPDPGGNVGDNDGQIGNAVGETGDFWYDLSLGVNLFYSSNQSFTAYGWNSAYSCPKLPIYNPTVANCIRVRYYDYGLGLGSKNYYQLSFNSWAAFLGKDALFLDQKIDDGSALTGKIVYVGKVFGGEVNPGCETSGTYNAADTNYSCGLAMQLGATSGITNN